MKRQSLRIWIHALVWAILFAMAYFFQLLQIDPLTYEEGSMFLLFLGGTLANALVFYTTVFRFIPFWQEHGAHWRSYLEPALLIASVTLFKWVLFWAILRAFHPGADLADKLAPVVLIAQILLSSMFIVFGTTYRLGHERIRHERVRKELEHQRLASELAFLKIQVNPHFLFNTLNNLFGLATREGAGKTAESLLKLADMMRYMMGESESDFLPLEREIECIRHYVDLQRLRISADRDVVIDFRIQGPAERARVPPMMLVTLVENAFKHGISFKEPSEILIHLTVEEAGIRFRVENTVNRKDVMDRDTSGIGLDNLKRRLALIFPGRPAALSCFEKNGRFTAILDLPPGTAIRTETPSEPRTGLGLKPISREGVS